MISTTLAGMARRVTVPPAIKDLLHRGNGVVLVRAARAAGIDESRLRRLVTAGELVRLAEGAYGSARESARLDDWQRFALKAQAFAMSCAPDTYLTGWAATVLRGLPTLGRPPERPVLIRPKADGSAATVSSRGLVRVATVPIEHLRRRGEVRLMSAAWSVADLARATRLPHALVVADAAVRAGADVGSVLPHMTGWPGVGRARWVAEHADPAAENALETLGRFTCIEYGLPMIVANAWVGVDGPEKRLDGLWPWHRCALEGDGALKYDNRDDASRIVWAQSEREFYLRRLGLDFARYGWRDVYPSREPLAERCRLLLRDNPPRDEPVRWWKHVPGVGPVEPQPEDWPSPHPTAIVLPAGWDSVPR